MSEPTQETKKGMDTLIFKLSKIQRELKAPKNQVNDFGGYNYRNCEDIMEAVKPFLDDLVLIVGDKIVNIGNRFYIEATAKLMDTEGNFIENTALAREEETKKGMDGAQVTGASSSYARKYALNGLFAIDDTKDPDSKDNRQAAPAKTQQTTRPTTPNRTYTPNKPANTPNLPPRNTNQAAAPVKPTTPAPTQPAKPSSGPSAEDLAVLDGNVPAEPTKDAYRKEDGEIARDGRGLTACVGSNCGKSVSEAVEKYSLEKFGKVLCMECQTKENLRAKGVNVK